MKRPLRLPLVLAIAVIAPLASALPQASAITLEPTIAEAEPAPVASATPTFMVTSAANDGPGSLRDAVERANTTPAAPQLIAFDSSVTLVTLSESITIESPITLRGNGAAHTEIRFDPAEPDDDWVAFAAAGWPFGVSSLTLTGIAEETVGISLTGQGIGDASIAVTDAVIQGFGDAGLRSWLLSGAIEIGRSSFVNNGTGVSVDNLTASPLTVRDTEFENNTLSGLEVWNYRAGSDTGVVIDGARFIDNGWTSGDWAPQGSGGASIAINTSDAAGNHPALQIVDTTFDNNRGAHAGGIDLTFGGYPIESPDTPIALIRGSTFTRDHTERKHWEDTHSPASVAFTGAPTRGGGHARGGTSWLLHIENSTFDHTAAAAAGAHPALIAGQTGPGRVTLDQVTSAGAALPLFSEYAATELRVSRSVIATGGRDPFFPAFASAGAASRLSFADTVFTADSAVGDFSASGVTVIPESRLGLGELSDNGGPTQTILPTANSPLLGAITGAVAIPTDQRGRPRPSGDAADIGAVEFQPEDAGLTPEPEVDPGDGTGPPHGPDPDAKPDPGNKTGPGMTSGAGDTAAPPPPNHRESGTVPLPQTGSSTTPWVLASGVAVLLAGAALAGGSLRNRRRPAGGEEG